jgi:hypothetical protein
MQTAPVTTEEIRFFADQCVTRIKGISPAKSLYFMSYLLDIQNKSDYSGDLLEIGIYAGRCLALMARYSRDNQNVIGIDTFQHVPLAEVKANLDSVLEDSSIIYKVGSSHDILSGQYGERWTVRFASIDGSHLAEDVIFDLNKTSEFGTDDLVVALDDFFNPRHPGVSEAYFKHAFMNGNSSSLAPFAYATGKLFLCRKECYSKYIEVAAVFAREHAKALNFREPPQWMHREPWFVSTISGYRCFIFE